MCKLKALGSQPTAWANPSLGVELSLTHSQHPSSSASQPQQVLPTLPFETLDYHLDYEDDASVSNELSASFRFMGFPSVPEPASPCSHSIAAPPRCPSGSVGRESQSRKRPCSIGAETRPHVQFGALSDFASSSPSSSPSPRRKSCPGREQRKEPREQGEQSFQLKQLNSVLPSIVTPLLKSLFQQLSASIIPAL